LQGETSIVPELSEVFPSLLNRETVQPSPPAQPPTAPHEDAQSLQPQPSTDQIGIWPDLWSRTTNDTRPNTTNTPAAVASAHASFTQKPHSSSPSVDPELMRLQSFNQTRAKMQGEGSAVIVDEISPIASMRKGPELVVSNEKRLADERTCREALAHFKRGDVKNAIELIAAYRNEYGY